jgi:LPXTG-motif cell wall-anchored protein
MGAFLVMVDNKTDLGVMALSLLALLAGIIFLGITQQKELHKKEILKYLIIAGIFFAFATLGKATAFVDLALFGIFLIGFWISPWSAVGVGLGLAGVLRYMNILTSSFMITESEAKWLIIIGGFLMLLGIALAVIKKRKV